jgi:hypothetical protein
MKRPPANEPPDVETETPHLLWFRTWYGIYIFVIGCFIIYVVLLTILSRAFS